MTQLAEQRAQTPEERSLEELAAALDDATARLPDLDPVTRQVATDLKDALDAVHRAALVRMVRALRADPRGKELLFELVDDPVVRMALLMHTIIRPDPLTLVRQVLDGVRPQLQSHGGDVELDRIEDATVYVRLSGACNGCSMSAVTMRTSVESAIKENVPGVSSVEIVPNEPGPALIPLAEIGLRLSTPAEKGWVRSHSLDAFDLDTVVPVTLEADGRTVDVIVVNVGGQLAAYLNACAHLGMPLDDADLNPTDGTLTCSWHGFCYDALSGECRTLPGTQLDPLPLRVDNGHVWIRIGS